MPFFRATRTSTSGSRAACRASARAIPYVVSGSGGFSATPPQTAAPAAGTTIGEYTLVTPPDVDFGYLTITVDMTGAAGTLTISYRSVNQSNVRDSVTVSLPPIGGAAIARAKGAPPGARARRRR